MPPRPPGAPRGRRSPPGLLPDRCERELLPAHRRLVHEPALGHGHDGDAVAIGQVGRRARGERDGRGLRVELEMAQLEVVERLFGLEEDDLTVGLSAQLEADRDLGERGLADYAAAMVHPALAPGAADPDRTFAD